MKKTSFSFATGAIALVFAVIGYETALLVHYGAVARIVANRDHPDTVYVYEPAGRRGVVEASGVDGGSSGGNGHQNKGRYGGGFPGGDGRRKGDCFSGGKGYHNGDGSYGGEVVRHNARHSAVAQKYRDSEPPSRVETFRFNPNTASVEELRRLGFSASQAAAIDRYRSKGGRFRRREDFAGSFAVPDSIYARLKNFVDIPRVDLNKADSAAFDALPGIGGYFARKMVQYRKRLGGYSCPEQLLEINKFDSARFESLCDLVTVSSPPVMPLWSASADSLSKHPYIQNASVARSIVFYREHNPRSAWTIQGLADAGIIDSWQLTRLSRLVIEPVPLL